VLTDNAPGVLARAAQRDAAILDSRIHGIEPVQRDGLILAPTGVPHEQWNGAWFSEPSTDLRGTLAAADQSFQGWGVRYGLVVPAELDSALHGPLEDAGATFLFRLRVMELAMSSAPVVFPPPGIRIRPAESDEDFRAMIRVQAGCFGDDEELWARYLRDRYRHPDIVDLLAVSVGRPDGSAPATVVGVGTLVVTGAAAGVYGIGVVGPWRRRGIGAALTAAVLAEGARRGCRIAHLNPSDAGWATYRRLGFHDVPGFTVWAPPGQPRHLTPR
jgi:GNAT superfamily N-acetyltransferase